MIVVVGSDGCAVMMAVVGQLTIGVKSVHGGCRR